MALTLTDITRFPIKSLGSEAVSACQVEADATLPWDRTWALAHEEARVEPGAWARCTNFARVASSPRLAAVRARVDEESGAITLSHPQAEALTVDPALPAQAEALVAWAAALTEASRPAPKAVHRANHGLTDSDYPSISLMNHASLRALGQRAGAPLDPLRFRGNLWFDGGPWEEFEWIGRELSIGQARFRVEERITRCRATMASPETGRIDVDTLSALSEGWGHTDFGVTLRCTQGGEIALGAPLTLL